MSHQNDYSPLDFLDVVVCFDTTFVEEEDKSGIVIILFTTFLPIC